MRSGARPRPVTHEVMSIKVSCCCFAASACILFTICTCSANLNPDISVEHPNTFVKFPSSSSCGNARNRIHLASRTASLLSCLIHGFLTRNLKLELVFVLYQCPFRSAKRELKRSVKHKKWENDYAK